MKTTLDLDDTLYRQLKAQAALNGQSVKTVITEAINRWLAHPSRPPLSDSAREASPPWVGSLSAYADNAKGQHDLASIRVSVAKGRRKK